jgi:hypothetical protein
MTRPVCSVLVRRALLSLKALHGGASVSFKMLAWMAHGQQQGGEIR